MQIPCSLLCCTILQGAYYVDILVIALLHNNVGSVLCRYRGHYFAAQYCRQCKMQISWSLLRSTVLQQLTMQLIWSLLCCTILQASYTVDILVVTLLHNTVGSVLCRYVGRYFAAHYSRQRTMQISWSLLCCTILQAAFYLDILVITFLHNIVGSVLCRYLGRYFAAQYCMQRTLQISWTLLYCTILRQRTMQICRSFLCCTILQAAY